MKTIKFSLLALSLSGMFLFSSCTEDDQTFPYTVTVTGLTFGPVADESHTQDAQVVTSEIEEVLSQYGASLGNIKKITPHAIEFTLTAPSNANFDAFGTIELYLAAAGKDTVKIAFTESIPNGVNTLSLSSQSNDISDYLQGNDFSLIAKEYNDEPVTQALTFDVSVEFTVTTGEK